MVLLAGAGCSSTPAESPAPTTPPPAAQLAAPELSLAEQADVKKLDEYLKTHKIPDPKLSNKIVTADRRFNGALNRSGLLVKIHAPTGTAGGVLIMEHAGKNYVVFDEVFTVPNGPELQVYLTKNNGITTRQDVVNGGVLLGKLKSTINKQVYEISTADDWREYHSVTIYSAMFNLPWAFAPLK